MPARITAVSVLHEFLPNPFRSVGTTAIDKRPVTGRVAVDVYGVAGDTQCDREVHGGLYQAVYAYADEDAAWWAETLGRDVPPGLFAENLRTSDVDVCGAEIGERWRIGEGADAAEVEVTSARIPCRTFAEKMGEPQWVKRFGDRNLAGAYLRVLRTGDVAAGDRYGSIRLVDRTKDLIKSGGEWIGSVELENEIMAHPKVAEAAVIAIPHEKWVERPLACVVVKEGETVTGEEIIEFLTPRVAKWWLPDAVEFIDEVPKTSVGKFSKKTLREKFADFRA